MSGLNQSFPKNLRLRARADYQRLLRDSQRFVGKWVIVDIREGNYAFPRLGMTVTRRYGKAHDRNRFKRIVREAFRLSYSLISPGLDLHVKPRSLAAHAKTPDIQAELLAAAKKFKK